MNENFVLDKSFASASGVLLLRKGEVVEFFPQTSNGKDLDLSDEIVLTKAEEAELTEALQDFAAKIKIVYQKMDKTQAEIDKLSAKSAERQKRIDASIERIERFFQ